MLIEGIRNGSSDKNFNFKTNMKSWHQSISRLWTNTKLVEYESMRVSNGQVGLKNGQIMRNTNPKIKNLFEWSGTQNWMQKYVLITMFQSEID